MLEKSGRMSKSNGWKSCLFGSPEFKVCRSSIALKGSIVLNSSSSPRRVAQNGNLRKIRVASQSRTYLQIKKKTVINSCFKPLCYVAILKRQPDPAVACLTPPRAKTQENGRDQRPCCLRHGGGPRGLPPSSQVREGSHARPRGLWPQVDPICINTKYALISASTCFKVIHHFWSLFWCQKRRSRFLGRGLKTCWGLRMSSKTFETN